MPPKTQSRKQSRGRTPKRRSQTPKKRSRTLKKRSRALKKRSRASKKRSRTPKKRSRSRSQRARARAYIDGWDKDVAESALQRSVDIVKSVDVDDRVLAKRIASSLYNVLVRKVPRWIARAVALPFTVSLLAIASIQGRNLFGAVVMGEAIRVNSWWIPTKFKKILKDSILEIRSEASLVGALEKYMYLRGFNDLEGGSGDIIIRSWGGYTYGDTYE